MARVTILDLQRMKSEKRKFIMMTAYEFQMARILDRAGVDIVLVGDSGGRNLFGHEDNDVLTLEEMCLMARSVSRGTQRALVLADMPFRTYQGSDEEAVRNAGRLIQEGGAQAVKVEAGSDRAATVEAIVRAGIPVMAHLGTSSIGASEGSPSGQQKTSEEKVVNDARAMEKAGAFGLFLSRLSPEIVERVTKEVGILTISGSQAAYACDGVFGFTYGVVGFSVEELDRPQLRAGSVAVTAFEAVKKFGEEAREGKSAPFRR